MTPETVLSFTIPTAGTEWRNSAKWILVTIHRHQDRQADIIQVVAVSQNSLKMLENSGVPCYREAKPFVCELVNAFWFAQIDALMRRLHEHQDKQADELFTSVTKTIQ